MKFKHPHSLGKQEARHRIERLSSHWNSKHGVAVSWVDDCASFSGKVKGVVFDAKLTIYEDKVLAEGTDPGFLMRAMVTAYLRSKLTDYLDPTKSIEDFSETQQ